MSDESEFTSRVPSRRFGQSAANSPYAGDRVVLKHEATMESRVDFENELRDLFTSPAGIVPAIDQICHRQVEDAQHTSYIFPDDLNPNMKASIAVLKDKYTHAAPDVRKDADFATLAANEAPPKASTIAKHCTISFAADGLKKLDFEDRIVDIFSAVSARSIASLEDLAQMGICKKQNSRDKTLYHFTLAVPYTRKDSAADMSDKYSGYFSRLKQIASESGGQFYQGDYSTGPFPQTTRIQ